MKAPKPMTPKGAPKGTTKKPTLKPVKAKTTDAGTYKGAKKNNANLDKLIARRKKLTKGTPEYNRVQNQINSAYGKGPQRDASIKKATAKKAGTISSGAKTATLKTRKAAPKPLTPAEKRKKAAAAKKSTRTATRSANKTARKAKRGLAKSTRQIKSIANKATRARKRAAIRRIKKG